MKNEGQHRRRSIRIPAYDYAGPGAYFVTIVTQDRECRFGYIENGALNMSPQGRIADGFWRAIPEHFPQVELGAYIVMPNHIHGIIILDGRAATSSPTVGAQHAAPLPQSMPHPQSAHRGPNVMPGSLGAIVRSYKSAVTKAVVQQFGGVSRVWQRNYFEHVIRDDDDWQRIHAYVESNIVNWAKDGENGPVGAHHAAALATS